LIHFYKRRRGRSKCAEEEMCPAPWTDSPPPLLLEDDYTAAPRPHPITHPAVEAPLCSTCRTLDLSFFDPSCAGCTAILKSRETSIGHILAILRQWVPQTQHAVDLFVTEIIKRGAHPDDRDSLTDMTLVMYACKSGASGVGSVDTSSKITSYLVDKGADLAAKCRWTDMAALHYATYFDVGPVLSILLHHTKGSDVDTQCVEYENGTPLHIAAANLCLGAARVLLKFGADIEATDDLGRRPIECIPDASTFELVPDAQELMGKMSRLLSEGLEGRPASTLSRPGSSSISGRTILQALGLKLNDRVVVGNKIGTLRFCGTTEFAIGMWGGVELDSADGKNDGVVKGIRYFRCSTNHGIFVPANKISKAGRAYRAVQQDTVKRPVKPTVNFGKVDVSHVQGKIQTAMQIIADRAEIRIGDRVYVKEVMPGKGCKGVVRFIGSVDFVDDMATWFGVELDTEIGRHDGTVQGVRYFAAGEDRGVFVTLKKLTKLDAEDNYNAAEDSCDTSVCESQLSTAPSSVMVHRRSVTSTPVGGGRVRRSLSLRHHENKMASSSSSTNNDTASATSKQMQSFNLNRSMSVRRSDVPDFQTTPVTTYNKFKKRTEKQFLDIGQSVMVIHSKEMALIKYVGHTDFAPGIWVGLELRNPKGKHNGEVQGRRYFSSKDSHGLMVKPRNISVHGINGQDLLRPETYYPI